MAKGYRLALRASRLEPPALLDPPSSYVRAGRTLARRTPPTGTTSLRPATVPPTPHGAPNVSREDPSAVIALLTPLRLVPTPHHLVS